jgi:hypothetical protein
MAFSRGWDSAKNAKKMFFHRLKKVMAFGLGYLFCFTATLFAGDKLAEYSRVLLGKNGFNYYLISQKKKANGNEAESVEVPVFALDQTPLYEGIKQLGEQELRVVSSLSNLRAHRRLRGTGEPSLQSPWAKHSIKISLDQEMLKESLNHLGKSFDDFSRAFLGMSESKARLLYALLFEDKLSLSSEARELRRKMEKSETPPLPTLESLNLSSDVPSPGPTRIPLNVFSNFFSDLVVEWILDIYVESLDIKFRSKEIEFNPSTNSATVRIQAYSAELTGLSHNIGRLMDGKFFGVGPYHDKVLRVERAGLGEFEVEFSFSLERDADGFWKIELLNAKRPLILKMKGLDPKVEVQFEGREKPDTFDLSEKLVRKIEVVLTKTLVSGLGGVFYPDDFGFKLPFQLSNAERKLEDDGEASSLPDSELEVQLSQLNFSPTGVDIFFDSRVNEYKHLTCVRDLVFPKISSDASTDIQPSSSIGWKLEVDQRDPTKWRQVAGLENMRGVVDSVIKRSALLQMVEAAARGGLYCISTRSYWPRPGYFPLVEFQPTESPRLTMQSGKFDLEIIGKMTSSKRDSSGIDRFLGDSVQNISLMLSIGLDPGRREIWWHPSLSSAESSSFENQRLQSLTQMALGAAFGADLSGNTPGGESYMSKYLRDNLGISYQELDFQADKQITKAYLDLDKLFSSEKKSSSAKIPEPKTLKPKNFPEYFKSLHVEVSWDGSDELFYSWRKRGRDDSDWEAWSSFDKAKLASLHFEKPGRYYFQVKAMNQRFEIEKEPVAFDLYVEGPSTEMSLKRVDPETKHESLDNEKAHWRAKDSDLESKTKAAAPVESKGVFGCALVPNHEGLSGMLVFYLLGGLLALLFLHIQKLPSKTRK